MFGSGKKAVAIAEAARNKAHDAAGMALEADETARAAKAFADNAWARACTPAQPPQEQYQQAILADFQQAVRVNDQAAQALRDAERIAAQAALALVEARKRMRRVTDGVV
jgi:hypothetical protein